MVDKFRTMGVRTNADTPEDAKRRPRVRRRGHRPVPHRAHVLRQGLGRAAVPPAEDDRLEPSTVRGAPKARRVATSCSPSSSATSRARWRRWTACRSRSACLDPPLHEFVPQDPRPSRRNWPRRWASRPADVKKRGEDLHETNPMMGHRGVRLGITYPEVTEMQIRAIFEAAAELIKAGKTPSPRSWCPVTCDVKELDVTKVIVDRVQAGSRRSRRASTCTTSTAR